MTPIKSNKARNKKHRTAPLEKLGRRLSADAARASNVLTGKYKNEENGN